MKHLKQIFIFISLFIIASAVSAQTFQVPQYSLKKKEDYAKYEKDIISCTNWLESTPFDQEKDKRKQANSFLFTWISGAPNVTVELNQNVVGFSEKNPDLLMIFLGGWTRFSLQNPDDVTNRKGTLAGLQSVVKFYKANLDKGLKKDKNVDNLVKLESEGKLEEYVNGIVK